MRSKVLNRHPASKSGVSRRGALGLAAGGAAALVAGRAAARPAPEAGRRIMSEGSDLLRSDIVAVAGRPMHMLVSTPAPVSDVPVVLVHGLALSGQYMVPTAEALAPHYRVHVPDFPGFGDSHKPGTTLDVPDLADALAAWMQAAGLERAVLLGNSFGCQIIVDLAARHPHLVAATVLQGPTTPPPERTWFWQFVRWRQNAPNNPPLMGEVADIDYAKCGIVRALMTFEFSLRDPVEAKLDRVAAPSLVIRGAEDPICHDYWAEQVAAGLPEGRLEVIPGVAHTLVFTSPAEMAALTHDFIDTL